MTGMTLDEKRKKCVGKRWFGSMSQSIEEAYENRFVPRLQILV
jgi:hypothetical protein